MPVLNSLPRAFSSLPVFLSITIILSLTIFARLIHILPGFNPRLLSATSTLRKRCSHIVIVLGSGGHTAEMMSMIRNLDPRRYAYRTYIVSSGDDFSASKAMDFEIRLAEKWKVNFKGAKENAEDLVSTFEAEAVGEGDDEEKERRLAKDGGKFEIVTVPRARKIHQSLYTTPLSSLLCLWSCMSTLRSSQWSAPDLILSNGPATGVIVILAALILRFFGIEGEGETGQMKTVYVESWARVKTLSLSGNILQWGLVDRFVVQWEGLQGGNREYKGVLVE